MEATINSWKTTHREGVDLSIDLLQSLGYRTERTAWDFGELAPGIQRRIRSMYLISSYRQGPETFEIFHIDFDPPPGQDVLRRGHIRPLMNAFLRRQPQGRNLFLVSGGDAQLLLVHPGKVEGQGRTLRRKLTIQRLLFFRLSRIDEWLLSNLRLETPEQTPSQLWEKHCCVFEELRQRRSAVWRGRRQHLPLFNAYREDLKNYPMPSRGSRDGPMERLRRGEPEAKQELIHAYLWFVVSEAKRYRNRGLELPDLIQQGNLGLLHAAQRFDPERGVQFSTYAVWWIRQSIRLGIASSAFSIPLPRYVFSEHYTKLLNLEKDLFHELGFLPPRTVLILMTEHFSDRERGEACYCLFHGVPIDSDLENKFRKVEKKVQASLRNIRGLVPLGLPIPPEISPEPGMEKEAREQVIELQDRIVSQHQPEEDLEKLFLHREIESILERLSEEEREVIECRFGLKDGKMESLAELARRKELDLERLRLIEARALKRLQHPYVRGRLRDYLEGNHGFIDDDLVRGTILHDAEQAATPSERQISEKEKKARLRRRQAHLSELKRWQGMNRRELLNELRSRLKTGSEWNGNLENWIKHYISVQRTNELEGLEPLDDFVFSESLA